MDDKTRGRLIRDISDILEIPEIGDVLRQKFPELKAMATKFRGTFIPAPLPENRAPSKWRKRGQTKKRRLFFWPIISFFSSC